MTMPTSAYQVPTVIPAKTNPTTEVTQVHEQAPAPVANAVGNPAAKDHADRAENIRDHRHPADLHV